MSVVKAGRFTALEAEQRHRHTPSIVDLTDHIRSTLAQLAASPKKTSLNSEGPASISIGRTSTPGWSMGQRMNVIPLWG